MSNFQSFVSSDNFSLFVVAMGFVIAGIAMLGISAVVSFRTRPTSQD